MKEPLGKVLKRSLEFKIQHKLMDSFPKRSLVVPRSLKITHIEVTKYTNKPARITHSPLPLNEQGGLEVI